MNFLFCPSDDHQAGRPGDHSRQVGSTQSQGRLSYHGNIASDATASPLPQQVPSTLHGRRSQTGGISSGGGGDESSPPVGKLFGRRSSQGEGLGVGPSGSGAGVGQTGSGAAAGGPSGASPDSDFKVRNTDQLVPTAEIRQREVHYPPSTCIIPPPAYPPAQARKEARKAEEIRQREAELLEARKTYFEERRTAEVKAKQIFHGGSGPITGGCACGVGGGTVLGRGQGQEDRSRGQRADHGWVCMWGGQGCMWGVHVGGVFVGWGTAQYWVEVKA